MYECRSAGVDFLVNGPAPLAGSAGDRARRHHKALAPTGLSILSVGKKSAASVRPSCHEPEIRSLIQRMSRQNVLWGAPRIHGELLKLGVKVCQTTVAKFMVRRIGPPSQRWNTFLRNHARVFAPSNIFKRLIKRFRSLTTRVTGPVKRRLTGLFRNLLSLSASSEERIVDKSVSCQSIHRPRHHTVIVPIDFARHGPPVVKPLLIDSSSTATLVAVVCQTPSGYTDIYCFRWKKVAQTIHLHHFPHRFDRLAA